MLGNKGVALFIVLWILVILELVVGGFIYLSRLQAKITDYHVLDLQTLALAKGGVEKAVTVIYRQRQLQAQSNMTPEPYPLVLSGSLGAGTYTVRVADEESKININTCSREQLEKIFSTEEIANKTGVINYILDRRSNKENLATLGELLAAGQVDAFTLGKLRSLLTTFSSGKFNINTGNPALLPGLSKEKVQAILSYRWGKDQIPGTKDDRALGEQSLSDILGEGQFAELADQVCYRGENFQVQVSAKLGSKAKKITAILQCKEKSENIGVKYWREE